MKRGNGVTSGPPAVAVMKFASRAARTVSSRLTRSSSRKAGGVYIARLLVSPGGMAPIWLGRNVQFCEIEVGQLIDEGVARRIVGAIKEQIHAGTYQPGDKLPSTRSFATEWGASRTTVTAA